MKTSLSLVFFGSGPVALNNLEALHRHFSIELVVTKPAKAHEKTEPPVVAWARSRGLELITPATATELDTMLLGRNVTSQLGVVVDFGMIISSKVISKFKLGIINSHFSLLPQLRGADPITFAILEGRRTTGVSLMRIVPKLDEGDLLSRRTYQLPPKITTPELTEGLSKVSTEMLVEYLPKYVFGEIELQPQDLSTPATYTRKLTKADSAVDWHKPAVEIERQIRAFQGWPKTRTRIGHTDATLIAATVTTDSGEAGVFHPTPEGLLSVYCGTGALIIDRLTPDGKNVMSGADFLRGYQLD